MKRCSVKFRDISMFNILCLIVLFPVVQVCLIWIPSLTRLLPNIVLEIAPRDCTNRDTQTNQGCLLGEHAPPLYYQPRLRLFRKVSPRSAAEGHLDQNLSTFRESGRLEERTLPIDNSREKYPESRFSHVKGDWGGFFLNKGDIISTKSFFF